MNEQLAERFREIAAHPDTEIVGAYTHNISQNPLYSEPYLDCNGVALLNHSFAGLSHYGLDFEEPDPIFDDAKPPEQYLPELIKDMRALTQGSLKAVLIGGDREHFMRIVSVLKSNKIPIIGFYLDYWFDDEDILKELDLNPVKEQKSLVVIPSTLEVIMHSDGLGYRRLV
jgi:hypothetical protein